MTKGNLKYSWETLISKVLDGEEDKGLINEYIKNGFDVNAKVFLETALHKASKKGNLEVVEILVNAGADINLKNYVGMTPLMCAIENEKFEVANYLIDNNADINSKTDYNTNALLLASFAGNIQIVEKLLKKGANINHTDNFGYSALFYAIENFKDCKMLNKLIDLGADINAKNKKGYSLLTFAVYHTNNKELVERLLELKLDVNDVTIYGETPLHWAAIHGKTEIAKILINNNADLSIKDKRDKTALDYAGNEEIKKYISLAMTINRNQKDKIISKIANVLEMSDLKTIEYVLTYDAQEIIKIIKERQKLRKEALNKLESEEENLSL